MTTEHIQIGDVSPRIQYAGNGLQTVFPYPFPIFKTEDMEVYLGADKQNAGFAISGAGSSDGGNVTFSVAPAAGMLVTLRRRIAILRVTDFQESGAFRAKTINDELDYQVAVSQQIADEVERSLKADPTDGAASLTLPLKADRADALLGFDAEGSPTAYPVAGFTGPQGPQGPQGPAGQNGTGSGDLLAANNLSDLADAAAARGNLGLGGAAILEVGTGAGTVAAGDHTHGSGGKDQVARDIAISAYIKADVAGSDPAGAYGRVFSDDFESDTLATKTGAAYDAAGKYYHNPASIAVSYIAKAENTADQTTYSFAASAFGSPSLAAGKLVLCIYGRRSGGSSPNSISTVTESGNALSQVVATTSNDGADRCEIWQLNGRSAGALGEIAVTFGYGQSKCGIMLYLIENGANAATDTDATFGAGTSFNLTLSVPAGGVGIGFANSDRNQTATWTGMTERADSHIEDTAYSSASTTASGDISVTYAPAANSWNCFVVASWAAAGSSGGVDMTLIPNTTTLPAEPNDAAIYVLKENVDSVSEGSDFKLFASIDGGTSWAEASLETVGNFGSADKLIRAEADVSAQTGTSFKWKITTHNSKTMRIKQVTAYCA